MSTKRYFYSVLKNEDATPFVGINVIIAADGLGGSGSTVHNVSPAEGSTLHDEIFKSAFYDFDLDKAQELNSYLEHWVFPMADGEPDTSALWASRIVIARCAYALCYNDNFIDADLSDEAVRAQLAKFISLGLDNTAHHFHLEKGKYDDQKVLPTTLAFIRFSVDKKGKTTAEVVWAGDSRCYLLTKSGLKQLSVDDEDKSGAITNLFYVGGKKEARLNYRKYVIDEPCVLMAVSDGIFDPFEPHDNLGVEKTLLEHISQSNSYEELMQSLSEFYDRVHADDATMAFYPIGLLDYKKLKKLLQDRTEQILNMWQKFYDMNAALEVADQSEEDVRSYVESRTRDKFAAITATLLANYKDNPDDLVYTEGIIEKITNTKAQVAEQQKKEAVRHTEVAITGVRTYLKEHTDLTPDNFFKTNIPYDVPSDIAVRIRNAAMYLDNIHDFSARISKSAKLADEKAKWREVIKERQHYYWQKFNEARNDGTGIKQREAYARWLKTWISVETQFEQGFNLFQDVNGLEPSDKKTAKEIQLFITNNKTVLMTLTVEIEKLLVGAQKRFCETVDKLCDSLLKMPSVCEKVLNEGVIKRVGLSEKDIQAQKTSETDVSAVLISQKDELVQAIVNAFAKHYDKTSMLDCYYNATRLNSFRSYYKLKMQPNTDVAEFEQQLKDLEAEYERLIEAE